MLQHYGPPYYQELCYGRYYPRPPGYLPPSQPQPDAQIGEPYPPPPQYYPGAPCYHNTHQRVPYMEYRGCSCPINSCPKNVLIGPATGKPPNSGGPGDAVPVAAAPPGGAFRVKARAAREPDIGTKEPEPPPRYQPPTHPPPFSGVSPKREICDEFRVSTDSTGPPSPARGSAGACAPQPPPAPPPRRARIGKAMLRKMLTGESTTALISTKPSPPPENDDVLVVSSPDVPIDLSSSDETEKRDEPHDRLLADVKKENEGPEGGHTVRKTAPAIETQALREHNSPCVPPSLDPSKPEPPKAPTKRRYSRPKLEVEPSLELVDGRSTNGIGEHVKLQKRRKLVPESEITIEKSSEVDSKKKSPVKKRVTKVEPEPKRCNKRKSSSGTEASPMKRIELETTKISETMDARLQNPAAVCTKPKIKSALLLDKLIRKNSVDRESIDLEPDPAELFFASTPTVPQGSHKLLNINNNVVAEKVPITDTRPKKSAPSIADKILAKLAEGKQAQKKLTAKPSGKTAKSLSKPLSSKNSLKSQVVDKPSPKAAEKFNKNNDTEKTNNILKENATSPIKTTSDITIMSPSTAQFELSLIKAVDKSDAKNTANKTDTVKLIDKPKLISQKSEVKSEKSLKLTKSDVESEKKCLKPIEKVSKLLCSKSDAKVNEVAAVDVMEEVCTTVVVAAPIKRTAYRRSSVGKRRRLKLGAAMVGTTVEDLPVPRSQPKWSNGWMWEGQPFSAKIYLNNDLRADAFRRCYGSMVHRGGDRVRRGDCVLLRAAARRGPEQPYVARVGHLWENPDDGEMMVSLVWYYRPEHTELARQPDDAPDEVFASRHRDANSVACIEDKCYVLTFNEYCRYRKRLKAAEEGVRLVPSIVPPMPMSDVPASVVPADSRLPPNISSELVLFCRKIYDFRSKKIQVPNK